MSSIIHDENGWPYLDDATGWVADFPAYTRDMRDLMQTLGGTDQNVAQQAVAAAQQAVAAAASLTPTPVTFAWPDYWQSQPGYRGPTVTLIGRQLHVSLDGTTIQATFAGNSPYSFANVIPLEYRPAETVILGAVLEAPGIDWITAEQFACRFNPDGSIMWFSTAQSVAAGQYAIMGGNTSWLLPQQ